MNGVSRAVLASALLLPAVGFAQQNRSQSQLNYTYAELGYDESDYGDLDGDGLTLSGSYALTDDWHLYGSYGTADLDFGVDIDTLTLGVGYRYELQTNVDLYGRVLYVDQNVNVPGADEDGLGLQFRIRDRVNDKLEVEGGVQYLDVGDSDTTLQASARYYFTNEFSAGIGITFGGDVDVIGINARYSF